MKTFNAPEVNVIKFDVEDIITVSGGGTDACPNLLDGERDE